MALHISQIDLYNDTHSAALLTLLDHYAHDPMGGAAGLSAYAKHHLIEALRTRPDFVGFLAWQDGKAVGLIHCFKGFSTFAAKPLLNVHDAVVLHEYRGKGISRTLFAAAEAWAVENGCCKLTLEVLDRNAVAMSAYASFGFIPYALDPAAGQAILMQKSLNSH